MALLREDLVELSIFRMLRDGFPVAAGYQLLLPDNSNLATATLHFREAFPTPDERQQELTITTAALSLEIDDGGKEMELGSNLTEYVHTVRLWVFGLTGDLAHQIAQSVKHIVHGADGLIPLLDFTQPEPPPQIDTMRCERVQVQHQVNSSAKPWDQYVYTAAMVVADVYFP